MNVRINFKSLSILLSLFCLPATTWGQALEEIIVTATKREESLQQVPISIHVFTGEQIREMRIDTAADIVKLAPNITISGQSSINRQINIRGVGTSDFFGNATGSVGIYMDEVTMSAPYLTGLGLFDLERVEVLRGPQNSLFGRNTTGGAVNYISTQPRVGEPNGYINLSIGNYGLIDAEGAYTFQTSENSALRIAAMSYNRDGIWKNVADNGADWGQKDRQSIRATFAVDLSDRTRITANIRTAKEDSDFDPIRAIGQRVGPGIPAPPPTDQVDFAFADGGGVATGRTNAQGDVPGNDGWENIAITGSYQNDLTTTGAYLKIEHEFDFAKFTSITSYDDTDVFWSYETGGIGNVASSTVSLITGANSPQVTLAIDQDQQYTQISQELRLTSTGDTKLRWIAGLYLFKEDSDLMQNIRFGAFSPPPANPTGAPLGGSLGLLALTNLVAGPNSPPVLATDNNGILVPGAVPVGYGNLLAFQYGELENNVISPYVHADWDVSDTFTITAGLRYTSDEKKMPLDMVGNQTTQGDPITQQYSTSTVLNRAAGISVECDADDDLNLNEVGNTLDWRGQVCTDELSRPNLKFDEWGGKLGISWRATENAMFYGSYSRGFRSGKHDLEFLHGPHTGFIIQDLDVETLDAFEIGVKSTLADGRLELNAATYFYRWNDFQTIFVNPSFGPEFVNIPETQLKGVEAEIRWAPADGWLVQGGVGFMDTEITEGSGTGFDEEGHELPFAAPRSANLLVIKDTPVGNGVLSLQADVQYRSNAKAYAKPVPLVDELEGGTFVNARIGYGFGSNEQYQISLWGTNLTEEETCQYKWDLFAFSGTTYCVANEASAFYGLEGRIRF